MKEEKNHPFCLQASEVQLLQGWKTAPQQGKELQLPKRSDCGAAQNPDDSSQPAHAESIINSSN